MKKITFLTLMTLLLTSFGWQANAQYCGPLNFSSVEPITLVEIADISNRTSASSTVPHEDFTAIVGTVNPGQTYQIRLEGFTGGNYTNRFFVFVDWNQNDILNDLGEVYVVTDYLVNSNGNDGKHVLFDIDVPAGASLGNTRMRVKKTYGTSNHNNPCLTQTSFGQVEDYTINVATSGGGGGNAPVIACPANITSNNTPGTCGTEVSFAGVAFDDEDGNISGDIIATPASGSVFPVGDTTVELSVTDSDGNTSTCSFVVTVVDNEDPIAMCKDITVDLDPVTGMASITGADLDNGSTDNCGIDSITLSKSSFDCADIGENTVTVTFTDNAGNTSTCTATVTVQDVTAPIVVCVGGFGSYSESEDFEGATIPAGWTTNVLVGTYDWTFGSGDMPTGGDFPTNAAIFDDNEAGFGEINVAELLSPVYNLTGATSADVSFDYALQEYVGAGNLTVEVYDGATWHQILYVDVDTNPTNTGAIDVSAHANATFQVKFTFDDDEDWGWGAGVDNFLLNYEAASGGGLDVYLDANGVASVNPNDLVVSVNEACSYTITAGGVGGGTPGSLTTLYATNNGGSAGWAIMYDLTVGASDIVITDLDMNTDAAGAFNLELYTLEGSYVGNETSPAAWGAPTTTGSGTGAGIDAPSNAVLADPVTLSANTTYGIAVVLTDSKPKYTNGTGCPGNQCYDNDDISLSLGTAVAGLFTGSVFPNRVWNGTVNYTTAGGSGLDFTCANLGENLVEVTVTDSSGNTATCMAVVNVIDNIAPVLTCGTSNVTTLLEDFEGATVPAGWTTNVLVGTQDWTFGSGEMPTGGNFPTNAAVFDDDAAGAGDNIAELISPVYDLTDVTAASISFDYALQDFNGKGLLRAEAWDGAAWQEVFIAENADIDPVNTGVIDVMAHANASFQVKFTWDDETGWNWGAGVDNFEITYETSSTNNVVDVALGADGTATIDPYALLSNIEEACGIATIATDVTTVTCADIGTSIMVTVFASDTSGNIASCIVEINVVDLLGPVITCPADQTVDPGPGNLFYLVPDYFATGEAVADDNCTDPVTITSQDPAPGAALPEGTHTIMLTATDEYGNSSTCSFELTVETVLGANQNSLESGVSLYPNPASQVVNLVNKTNISLDTMMIFDVNGKMVSQINLSTMQGEKAIDVSSLATGVYVVQIIGDNVSTVKRLIKE